jgi:hypothetical protein
MARVRLVLALVAVVTLGAVTPAAAPSPAQQLSITFRIDQGVTERHPHPPAGDAGDVFSVVLTLLTIEPAFGKPADTRVGRMVFSYVLRGTCSAGAGGCTGTTDVRTVTTLPGGTITATGTKLPIRTPFVVAVRGGTGRYAGARGRIVIAPGGAPRNVYKVTFPGRARR